MIVWCFHGWAQPPDGMRAVLPEARHIPYGDHTPEDWARHLPDESPDLIVGWSLGGQLAVQAALRTGAPALVLLAAPWRFVAAPDWQAGMGRTTYDLFRQNYATQPERTARRFAHLVAQGDAQAARIEAEQAAHLPVMADQARWLPWLDALGEDRLAVREPNALPRTLIVQGVRDQVVRPAQAEHWHAALPHSELHLWEACGHAPHLHDAARLRALILAWSARHAR